MQIYTPIDSLFFAINFRNPASVWGLFKIQTAHLSGVGGGED
jgi:hypothetical protein